jgi:hypothetical protein
VLTQAVPQVSGSEAGHSQLPALQISPVSVQAWPQVWQLAGSVWRSTHAGDAPGHLVAPRSQAQLPPEHVPRPQAWVQEPQWSSFVARSTHSPLQEVCPDGQDGSLELWWQPAREASPSARARRARAGRRWGRMAASYAAFNGGGPLSAAGDAPRGPRRAPRRCDGIGRLPGAMGDAGEPPESIPPEPGHRRAGAHRGMAVST